MKKLFIGILVFVFGVLIFTGFLYLLRVRLDISEQEEADLRQEEADLRSDCFDWQFSAPPVGSPLYEKCSNM